MPGQYTKLVECIGEDYSAAHLAKAFAQCGLATGDGAIGCQC